MWGPGASLQRRGHPLEPREDGGADLHTNAQQQVAKSEAEICSNITIRCFGDQGTDQGTDLLTYKVRKELLPCLRSFTSSLRVAEEIVGGGAGLLIREFPREAYTIKTLEDSLSFLNTPDGLERYKHVHAVS